MAIMDSLQPYFTSPMWISLIFTVIILLTLPFLIKFMRRDIWNDFFHNPYWHAYILSGDSVIKRIIVDKDLKQSKIKLIEMKPYTWIIKDNSWINYKSASIIFLDVNSCVSTNLESEEQKELFKEIQNEKDNKKILSRIPIINRFALSKNLYSPDKLVGFATKIKANPEFIINAVTFHIFLKQKFTNDIIKVPKTLWEILEENLTLIIIVILIFGVLYFIMQKTPSL